MYYLKSVKISSVGKTTRRLLNAGIDTTSAVAYFDEVCKKRQRYSAKAFNKESMFIVYLMNDGEITAWREFAQGEIIDAYDSDKIERVRGE